MGIKAGQAATSLEDLARILESAGSARGSADIRALATYLREAANENLNDVLPEADAETVSRTYLRALQSAGSNRQLFASVYDILRTDKLIDSKRMAMLASSYSSLPGPKNRPKALQLIRDQFETLVQRERKQQEIKRLTD